MSITADLIDCLERETTRRFQQAVPDVHQAIISSPTIPRDTLNLQQGIRITKVSPIGSVKEARIESLGRSPFNGTDYPAILQYARRIQPRNPDSFIRFVASDGQFVSSKGFTNIHFQWWTTTLGVTSGPSIWLTTLQRHF